MKGWHRMKIIDLTHAITPAMPVYPGTEPPQFQTGTTIEQDGFRELKFTLFLHTGTHIDAPSHLEQNGMSLDQMPVDRFFGRGMVIQVAPGQTAIRLAAIRGYEQKLQGIQFVLFHTGWSARWGTPEYFRNFPTLDLEAATWLAEFPLHAVGTDAISVDAMDTSDFPVHRALIGKNMFIIENLAQLECLVEKHFYFSCFPLKIENADGSPVRATALIPEE